MSPLLTHRNNLSHFARHTAPQHSPKKQRSGLILNWMNARVRNWKRRKMIATLQALDDRMLRDIGITRSEITNVVDGFNDRELNMAAIAPAAPTSKMPIANRRDFYQKAA